MDTDVAGGVPIELGECLGRGGEARVYALKSDPSMVAKLYHHPTAERAAKLAAMVQHPPAQIAIGDHTVIAWPQKRLFAPDKPTLAAGFLMPRVTAGLPAATLHNTRSRLNTSPQFTWRYLLRAAMNLSLAVQRVHDGGYVIGDVNDQGVLVTDTALVALVDCDSFQVRDPETGRVFRCPVGSSLFTPPELAGQSFAEIDRERRHDLFGLAVVIHLFLMGGHPFQVKAAQGAAPELATIEACIARGLYPDLTSAVARPPIALPLEVLPPAIRALFRAAFGPQPERRPDAAAWASALWQVDRELVQCDRNSHHAHGAHLLACPWCARAASLGGRDPFPSPEAIRDGDHLKRAPRRRTWHRRLEGLRNG